MIYIAGALLLLSVILSIYCIKFKQQARTQIFIDEDTKQQNEQIAEENKVLYAKQAVLIQDCENKQKELKDLIERAKIQSNVAQSMTALSKQLQEDAEQKAQEAYERKKEQLDIQFQQQKEDLERAAVIDMERVMSKLKEKTQELADIEAKQQAYLEAQQRAEEIEAQRDYYRLVISDEDLADVKLLRNIQTQLRKRDSIDKVIYETYYRPAYDVLMAHLSTVTKISGIYKITNMHNDQAYIGQSVDIKERLKTHIKTALSSAPSTNKLYQEMKKYGPENFTFEILEEVDRARLNEREIYWIDFYKTKQFGMNGTRGGAVNQ